MPSGAKHKLGVSGIHLLAAMGGFALLVALVAVPAIADATGISQTYVTYAVAGVCFVVAVVASRWARALNEKKVAE